jgi:hypothetical protein
METLALISLEFLAKLKIPIGQVKMLKNAVHVKVRMNGGISGSGHTQQIQYDGTGNLGVNTLNVKMFSINNGDSLLIVIL